MTTRIARHHLFAVLGLAFAALAMGCLAVISFPPTFDMPVTKANLVSGHLWITGIPQKIPGTLRPLYRISNGDIDGDRSAKLMENGRPLGRTGGTTFSGGRMSLRMRVNDREPIGSALRRFKKLLERSGKNLTHGYVHAQDAFQDFAAELT